MRRKRRRKKLIKELLLSAGLIIAAAAIFLIVLTVANKYQITFNIPLNDTVSVEYGDLYEEPEVKAVYFGTIFDKGGKDLEVVRDGNVNNWVIGTYTVTYTAKKGSTEETATRTVIVRDTTAPEIKLLTNKEVINRVGEPYQEEGFSAFDICDGDLTERVIRTELDGQVRYEVTDAAGNRTEVIRTIVYYDTEAPVLNVDISGTITLEAGSELTIPAATASDDIDGDITDRIVVSQDVDINTPGDYTIVYTVSDNYGNETKKEVSVHIFDKKPVNPDVPSGKIVYLTFDDGPDSHTQPILDILAKYNAKATFFVTAQAEPFLKTMLPKEAEAGHTIAIHTYCHEYSYIYATEENFWADQQKVVDAIKNFTGQDCHTFRFPGGTANTVSAKYNTGIMTRLVDEANRRGMKYIDWNVTSGDATTEATAELVASNVIAGIQKYDVSIVLLHDIHQHTVDALEPILIWGLENGYTFLAIDENTPECHFEIMNK